MVLDKIPGKKIFAQRDVRETPASTATATAVGLTDVAYIVQATDGDLTADRVITAGEGIDFDDAGAKSTFTIKGEDASTTNKGIAKFSAGEGMNISITAGDVTYSGENATTSNKGIASFASADFAVSSGAVSLDDDVLSTVDGDTGTATGSAHNLDILGGTGIATIGASNDITISSNDEEINHDALNNFAENEHFTEASINHANITAGDGSDHTNVATNTTHSGSNGSDHSLLTNKTSYYSIPGNTFIAISASTTDDVDNVTRGTRESGEGAVQPDENAVIFLAPVHLPQGSIVTGCIVYGDGDAQAETWNLVSHDIDTLDTQTLMATAAIGTADTSIQNAIINNQANSYFISTTSLDTGDQIFGAVITYTTNYD